MGNVHGEVKDLCMDSLSMYGLEKYEVEFFFLPRGVCFLFYYALSSIETLLFYR